MNEKDRNMFEAIKQSVPHITVSDIEWICSKLDEVNTNLMKIREAYRQVLIIIGKCPQCHKSFGPQYTSFGNKPAEMICDCDGQHDERTHHVVVNETTIMQHINTLDRR